MLWGDEGVLVAEGVACVREVAGCVGGWACVVAYDWWWGWEVAFRGVGGEGRWWVGGGYEVGCARSSSSSSAWGCGGFVAGLAQGVGGGCWVVGA